MNNAPIVVFDKSAFEAVSYRDHFFVLKHLRHNLVPILVVEIMADLSKCDEPRRPTELVLDLARKFHGGGPPLNTDHLSLLAHNLLGQAVAMDGRICLPRIDKVPCKDGGYGLMVPTSPLNESILRWARGQFTRNEEETAGEWRRASEALSMEHVQRLLEANYVILPRAASLREALSNVDDLLNATALQNVWLDALLQQGVLGDADVLRVRTRWAGRSSICISDFAPYASYCLRLTLLLASAQRSGLVGARPTDSVDLMYLYYLPFCQVFVSDDRIHKALAPLIIRSDQQFVKGQTLKADLHRLKDFWTDLQPTKRARLQFALGFWPPPLRDSLVHSLWKRYMAPWRPSSGNMVSELPIDQKKLAMKEVAAMFREVEGEEYFEGVDIDDFEIVTLTKPQQGKLVDLIKELLPGTERAQGKRSGGCSQPGAS